MLVRPVLMLTFSLTTPFIILILSMSTEGLYLFDESCRSDEPPIAELQSNQTAKRIAQLVALHPEVAMAHDLVGLKVLRRSPGNSVGLADGLLIGCIR